MPHALDPAKLPAPLHNDPEELFELAHTHPGIRAVATGLPLLSYTALGGADPHSPLSLAMDDLASLSSAMGYPPSSREKLATAAHSAAISARRRGAGFDGFVHGMGNVLGALSQAAPLLAAVV